MSTKEARFGFFIGSPTLNIENCLDLKIRETVENTYNITDEQIEIICLAFSNEKIRNTYTMKYLSSELQ